MSRATIDVLPFERSHLDMIEDRPEQRGEAEQFQQARGLAADYGPAWTIAELGEDGTVARILCCAGLAENSPTWATAWAYFAADLTGHHWGVITRAIRAVLDACTYSRVDMIVRAGFDAAHGYAAALGFGLEGMIYARPQRAAERIET